MRSILEDYVSKDISRAKKKGWTMPVDRWLGSTPNNLLNPIMDGVFFKNFMTGEEIKILSTQRINIRWIIIGFYGLCL